MPSKLCNGIRSVIAAFLHQFSLYPLFMLSNIIPFMISYLYHLDKESSPNKTSNITQEDGYFIHPIMCLCMSLCAFFGGVVEHYVGPKYAIIIGGVSLALGDTLFIFSKSLIFDYCINIFFGIGFGISITAGTKNATKYFPKKRGLITSLVAVLGGNLGSSFFNLIIKLFVSKGDYPKSDDNNMYQKSTAENYKIFLCIHGGVALSFSIIVALLLVNFDVNEKNNIEFEQDLLGENSPLEKTEEEKQGINEKEENKNTEKNKNIKENKEINDNKINDDEEINNNEINGDEEEINDKEEADKNDIDNNNNQIENKNSNKLKNLEYKKGLKEIFKHFKIYLIFFIYLLTVFLQGFTYTVGFNFGTMPHNDDSSKKKSRISPDNMSLIFMLSSLISGVMGPITGLIYDKIHFRAVMIIIDILSCANGVLINYTVKWGVYFYGISIILNGYLNSSAFSLLLPHVSKVFGFEYAGELYGFVSLSTGISNMTSSSIYYIVSHFSDKKNDKNYFYIFIAGASCCFIAAVLAFFDKEKKFKFNKDVNENENDEDKINNIETV